MMENGYALPGLLQGYRRWMAVCALLLPLFFCFNASASRLIIRIQAANTSDQPRPVPVRASLPARVSTNDIINLAGLNLGYDVKSDTYFVHGTLDLAPREIAVREVEIKDIWLLDEAKVRLLSDYARQMVSMLSATPHATDAAEAASRIENAVSLILQRQSENRISVVSPVRHIQAYEENLRTLQEVRRQIGDLENQALASGINPGETLLGDDRRSAAPRREGHRPAAYGEAMLRITVMNSSTAHARTIPVRRELPPEVTIEDVIDAGGLSIRYDPKERLTVVYADEIEIGPLETQIFEVRIRDKWNVNGPRIDYLQDKVTDLRMTTSGRNRLAAIDNMLESAVSRLATVAGEQGPDTFSPAYISFYRRQADRLDAIENDLNRIDSALRPLETRRGFTIPAPDQKTTWLVIYAILGFLALISLLFFFRWFVKS